MLTKEEVLQVARLARLDLDDEEVERFRVQLSGILELFKKIDDVDLKGIEETSQVTGLTNVSRDDKVICREDQTCCTTEELLAQTPLKEGSSILVPKVIEDKDDA